MKHTVRFSGDKIGDFAWRLPGDLSEVFFEHPDDKSSDMARMANVLITESMTAHIMLIASSLRAFVKDSVDGKPNTSQYIQILRDHLEHTMNLIEKNL
ncbi:MAG: hypothetical protein WCW03_00995 [Candidatus Paceibacterota bacterium]|jgi:hypothetical protein